MSRYWIALIPVLAVLLVACAAPKPTEEVMKKQYEAAPGILEASRIENATAVITTSKGTITLELFPKEAPKTVSNFVFLADDDFYDGLTFHRVEPGFVIQGGDPSGNGTGGPGYTFEDEPVTREYKRGIVALAHPGAHPNGGQSFTRLAANPLPPQYTIFGQVTAGMDVVDQIAIGDVMETIEITRP